LVGEIKHRKLGAVEDMMFNITWYPKSQMLRLSRHYIMAFKKKIK
jgi:hypothetical protein